jgi:hypothetical protein
MVPMAIPSFGGMLIAIMTMLVVPVLYCSVQEWKLRLGIEDPRFAHVRIMSGNVRKGGFRGVLRRKISCKCLLSNAL